jgi:hypothetical protein
MPTSPGGKLRLNEYQAAVRTAAKDLDMLIRDQNVERYRGLIRNTPDQKQKHQLALLIREKMRTQSIA